MTTKEQFSDLGLYDKKSDEIIPIFFQQILKQIFMENSLKYA